MISQIFETRLQLGTDHDRRILKGLATHPGMGSGAPLVYIYSLNDEVAAFNYPLGLGRTVYIGQTKRETGAWRRFDAHFSISLTEGLSTLINHTLSVLYHNRVPLRLRVFSVAAGRTPAQAERILLRAHLNRFGAMPMGQGSSGKENSPAETVRVIGLEAAEHGMAAELVA